MSDQATIACGTCSSSRTVKFCRNCARISCKTCLVSTSKIIYRCPTCTTEPNSEVCGSCGSEAEIDQQLSIDACPVCSSNRLEDPEVLIDNISSNYYEIITRVETIQTEFIDLYRSFDVMVALVRFCRYAGLYGLPQMEMQLETCSNALKKINDQSIDDLNQIRKEGLYEIRSHKYFKEVDLDHVRSIEGTLRDMENRIENHLKQVRHWINQVKGRLKELTPTAYFLRQHYDILNEISRYLPAGVDDIAAIIPPLAMNIKTKKHKENDECYIIFTEKYCIFLPKRATEPNSLATGIKIPYAEFVKRERANSLLKGIQLKIQLETGQINVSAPPQVLDKIEQYFGLIDSEEPYMVGSPKKIISIERNTPDKNEYKRAANKMINIFREWLFDDRVQKSTEEKKLDIPSITDLKSQLDRLEKMYSNYNYQARHHQIPIDKYQSETAQIKDNYASIKDKLARLSGHFGDIDTSFMGQ